VKDTPKVSGISQEKPMGERPQTQGALNGGHLGLRRLNKLLNIGNLIENAMGKGRYRNPEIMTANTTDSQFTFFKTLT
jgi:hypothetical protein